VVDKVLKPPFIMDFLEMTFNITGFGIDTLVELVRATNSSLGDLAEAEVDQHVTLFAPLDSNFEAALSEEDQEKLLSPAWSRHLRDMLLNLIAPLPYTYDGLFEMAQSGTAVEVIGGSSYELTVSDGGIGVQSGMLVRSSPAAIDG
jgi:uncharacterized surface protein with fasciclin (FAS1) repeats